MQLTGNNHNKKGGISYPRKLGGIVGLSTWLTCLSEIPGLITDANKETVIFQAHGEADPLIRLEWAEKSRDILRNTYGRTVDWHSYPNLQHSADPQEIDALEKWLEQRVSPLGRRSFTLSVAVHDGSRLMQSRLVGSSFYLLSKNYPSGKNITKGPFYKKLISLEIYACT